MTEISAQQLSIIGFGLFVFSVLGIISAIQAVLTARTSQGAIAWAVTLLTWPLVAVPAYWILGRNRFRGYVDARRDRRDSVFAVLDEVRGSMKPYVIDFGTEFGDAKVLEKLAHMRFCRGNETELLVNGRQTFDAIFEAIDQASRYVLVEFFIIHDDELGRELKSRLVRKSEQGVDVYLLYDDVGSSKMTSQYLRELRDAGVRVTGMNTTRGWRNRFQINFRNHRKIVIVDGRVAFIGGHNVGDEYVGKHPKLTPWRDTHMSILGPAALAAQLAFVEDWHWATQSMPDLPWEPQAAPSGDKTVFVLPSGPADEYETCGLFFTHAINSAKARIWIATPYFVPDEGILTSLQLAALRGVDVRVLIPGLPDKPMIKSAAMAYAPYAIEAGVKMYEYGDGFLHQKVMLIDEHVATIGTANFDNRSFRLNFEISVLTFGAEFAGQVEEMLRADFAKSTLIDQAALDARSTWSKLQSQVSRLFAPVL